MPKNHTSSTLFADGKRSVFGFLWRRWRNLALIILSFVIPACGGGGGDPPRVDPPSTSKANLVVDIVTHSECSADRGSLIDISESIRNSGSASASAFRVSLYLSEDQFIETTDIFLAKRDISSLSVGETSSTVATIQIPAGLNIGTYYVGAIVDDQGSVDEERTDDNTAVSSSCVDGALVVTEPVEDLPDLTPLSTSHSPCSVYRGDTIDVSDSVMNQGNVTSGSFRVGIFLSTDNDIQASSDLLLGYREVGSLDSFETSQGSSPLIIQAAEGTYFIGTIVDYRGDVTEGDEWNNSLISSACGLGQIVVLPPPSGVDLVLDSFSHSPCTIDEGDQVSVSMVASNIGGTAAGGFRIGVYRSSDSVININDYLLGYQSVATLGPGGSSAHSASFTINIAGSYYIGGIVDYLNQVVEGSENNNSRLTSSCSGKVLVEPPPSVDLIMDSVTHYLCTADIGSSITVDSKAKNNGGVPASFEVGIYLSTDTTITPSDHRIGEYMVNSLNPGSTHSNSSGYTVPTLLSAGTYYVGGIADWNGSVSESNEGNNSLRSSSCSNGSLTVTDPPTPDLTMTTVSHSGCSANQGASITVNSTIMNSGGTTAASSEVGIYLSTNTTISTIGYRIGSYPVPSLGAGATFSNNAGYTVPILLATGTYYVGCIADWNGNVAESNDSNNALRSSSCSNGSLTVTTPPTEAYLYPRQDVVVASGVNSGNSNMLGTGWDTALGLGDDVNCIYGSLYAAGPIWTYIEFDVSDSALISAGVPSNKTSSLLSSDFEWFKTQDCNAPYGSQVFLEANSSSWSESTITFNNQPAGGGPTYQTYLTPGTPLRWPLLSPGIWNYWRGFSGGAGNHGMLIRLGWGSSSGTWAGASSRSSLPGFAPRIKVTW